MDGKEGRPALVVGLGAGGHAKVVIEILRFHREYELVGLLDVKPDLRGSNVLGVPVLGGDQLLPQLKAGGVSHFFVGLGATSDLSPRRRLYDFVLSLDLAPVSAIHPAAVISPSVTLGRGITVMASAVINAGATLGENVIVNTGAVVEHDCVVGDHVHIASRACLASTVHVGDGAFVGAGATVRQLIRIGPGAIIGAGAVVVKNVGENQMVLGNPARPGERRLR